MCFGVQFHSLLCLIAGSRLHSYYRFNSASVCAVDQSHLSEKVTLSLVQSELHWRLIHHLSDSRRLVLIGHLGSTSKEKERKYIYKIQRAVPL